MAYFMKFVLLGKNLILHGMHYVNSSWKNWIVQVCYQSLSPTFINLRNEVQKLSKAWKLAEKENFLSEPFLPSQPKTDFETGTATNNPKTFSRETDETEDCEHSLLESSFSDLAQSVAELNTSYDEVENENISLSLDIEETKSKNMKLKRQQHEKNKLLSHFGVRNFNEWERRKTDKIKKLEETVTELTEKTEIIETREIALEKNYNREK